jgi:uncharacterized RDD family membrane protein YckC
VTYPSLLRRIIALNIDIFILLALFFAFSRSPLYDPANKKPIYWPLLLLLLYEPIFTAYLCTLGQWAVGARVRTVNTYKHVPLWRAFIRLLVKDSLGIISFVLMPRQKQRRALHDLASGTIVIEARDARAKLQS